MKGDAVVRGFLLQSRPYRESGEVPAEKEVLVVSTCSSWLKLSIEGSV